MTENEPIRRLQEEDGWCGPACIQAITRQRGMTYSQSEIATILGTTVENGTSHSQMFNGAIKLGLQPTQVRGMRIDMLAEVLPQYHVIVNWMDGTNEADDGHYSLLKQVNDRIHLEDAVMTKENFDVKWYDLEDGKRIDRWAMIVPKNIH